MKKGLQATIGLLLGACSLLAHADGDEGLRVMYDGELMFGYDSNVTRAAWSRDVVDDGVANASLAVVANKEFGLMSAATLRGFAEGEAYNRVDSINRAGYGLQAMYRWQNRLGFTAPFYQISLTAQRDDSAADLRDANRYTAQVFMTRRITDAFRASVGVEASRQQSEGVVFDTDQARLFLNADLQVSQNWALYGTYSLVGGDAVSSARQVFCNGALATDTFELIDAADAIETDMALNESLCGSWLAYRLPAVSHVAVFGANRGFGHHLSLDLSSQYVLVKAEGDNEYERMILRAGILARF